MSKIPTFKLYGQDDPKVEENIQPSLGLRQWTDLAQEEKEIAFQQLKNSGWAEEHSSEILNTIKHLNDRFLRQCPGKHLHQIKPEGSGEYDRHSNEYERKKAALMDFYHIFITEKSESMVLRMFSKFAESHIDFYDLQSAEKAGTEPEKKEYIEKAFEDFDKLANCFNHIFEQFAVNVIFTRNGLVPRQEEKIMDMVYTPTLAILADPKWKNVSDDIAKMFEEYREKNYPEVITKAHSAVQRFLQVLVGEEGKNAKGEVGKLFEKAKKDGLVPIDRFSEPIINSLQGFLSSERATNSTAKPTLKEASPADALLIMNVTMIFLQHCLQNTK